MEMCQSLRKRSTCSRGKVGAIAVTDDRIIATAYNGAPPGMAHCTELGCDVDENNHVGGCTRAIHAEGNLVAFAAKHGVSLWGSIVYSTCGPCLRCAQLLIASGVARVVYQTPYRLPDGVELLDAANIPIEQIS
jgi:dCMP deaminase